MLTVYALVALTTRIFVLEPFKVPSVSMDPALPYGSSFFAYKSAYGYTVPYTNLRFLRKKPERGDIVIYYFDSGSGVISMVKRVIGLPGDTVQLRQGIVYLNGQALKLEKILDPYQPQHQDFTPPNESSRHYALYKETLPNGRSYRIIEENGTVNTLDNTELFKVPEGHYFLMGDNRDNSQDSRVLEAVGYVEEKDIYAKAAFIYWDDMAQKFVYSPVE